MARANVRIASLAGTDDASCDFASARAQHISQVVKCERASPEVPSPSRFRTPVRRAHRPRADLLARSRSLPPARYATRGRSPSPRPRDPPHVQGHLRRDSGCRICLGRLDPNRAALPRRARGAPPGAQLPLVAHQGAQLPEDYQRPLRGAFPGKPARAAPLISPSPRPARFKSNRLVITPPARDASEPPTSSNALHPPQTTMVELTALRKEIGEVRAVTSELRDARTELTNARVSLGEVARRVAGAEGAKATTARRVLARGSYGDEDAEVVPGENEYRAPRRAGPGRETRGGSIERGAMTSARTRRHR